MEPLPQVSCPDSIQRYGHFGETPPCIQPEVIILLLYGQHCNLYTKYYQRHIFSFFVIDVYTSKQTYNYEQIENP